jgi:argininosuccinate synthase
MKIVLAYSGGLDTSVLVTWLKDKYNAEIIAFCADIGQGEELSGLRQKAKRTGASKMYIDDLREEFASDFIFPMMQAGAIYEDQYYLGTSIARPLIAKRMVEIAIKEKAHAIAHGATGKGNDQVRFELTAAALAPEIEIIAPWRMKEFRSQFPGRKEMIQYCRRQGVNVEASARKPYSMDRNLLHISYEAGILEDIWFDAFSSKNKDMFKLSVAPSDAMLTAQPVKFLHYLQREKSSAIYSHANPLVEIEVYIFGLVRGILWGNGQLEHIFILRAKCIEPNIFQYPSLIGDMQQVAIHAIRLSSTCLHINSLTPAILNHLFSAWKL